MVLYFPYAFSRRIRQKHEKEEGFGGGNRRKLGLSSNLSSLAIRSSAIQLKCRSNTNDIERNLTFKFLIHDYNCHLKTKYVTYEFIHYLTLHLTNRSE